MHALLIQHTIPSQQPEREQAEYLEYKATPSLCTAPYAISAPLARELCMKKFKGAGPIGLCWSPTELRTWSGSIKVLPNKGKRVYLAYARNSLIFSCTISPDSHIREESIAVLDVCDSGFGIKKSENQLRCSRKGECEEREGFSSFHALPQRPSDLESA